ncbi:hypothetical protein EJ05DRAFT_67906 [Pseudovirgaria hyperparasitica]|uniref:Antigenic cell wall galactomanno protein n=1 Tax=Pseudovirgaria hyperparasitica TaxID=470096 RepID=A0A6A6W3H5_9PEZI|nr:uncharacterized protein EJ05DRAFT_67906 [Pseudovirgaria hyperparasitica]KAF2756564.1 hypothetical protein EJ05DRAFT_67906 [Pseudovirgaria hyperparasitica]
MYWFNPLVLVSTLTLASAAVLPAVEKRDGAQTVKDINSISSQTDAIYKQVNDFKGGPLSSLQALGIQTASIKLDNTIKQGTKNANKSAKFTSDESNNIAIATLDLQPKVTVLIDALINKKQGFQTALLGLSAVPLVKQTLTTLRADTKTFGQAVTAKLTPDIAELAPIVLDLIDQDFARGIAAFS